MFYISAIVFLFTIEKPYLVLWYKCSFGLPEAKVFKKILIFYQERNFLQKNDACFGHFFDKKISKIC